MPGMQAVGRLCDGSGPSAQNTPAHVLRHADTCVLVSFVEIRGLRENSKAVSYRSTLLAGIYFLHRMRNINLSIVAYALKVLLRLANIVFNE